MPHKFNMCTFTQNNSFFIIIFNQIILNNTLYGNIYANMMINQNLSSNISSEWPFFLLEFDQKYD